MKYLFALACAGLGVALSILSNIMATGRIPFREPAAAGASAAPASATEPGRLPAGPLLGQDRAIDDLKANLTQEKERYEAKVRDLTGREAQIQQQKEIMEQLQTKVKTLQADLEGKIVEMAAAEVVNLRRLADVYSKMEPSSASALLEQMEENRAARVLSMISERQAAAILDATVARGEKGATVAGKWSDGIRRMKEEKKGQ